MCSSATSILARLNLAYVMINSKGDVNDGARTLMMVVVGTTVAAIVALLVASGDNKVSTRDAFTLFENNSTC